MLLFHCKEGFARTKWCPTPVSDPLAVCCALVVPRTCGVSWYEKCVVLCAVGFEIRCGMSRLLWNRVSAQLRCLQGPPQHPSLALLQRLLQPHQAQAPG
jgi:hypothetical protein